MRVLCVAVLAVVMCAVSAAAEFLPMSSRASLFAQGTSTSDVRVRSASLFAGPDRAGLFAPQDAVLRAEPARPDPGRQSGAKADLLDLIAKAEAGPKGYNAVQYGARIKPGAPPTTMTLGEIYDWIDATPGQPHAIGRYQFIPKTLRWLADRLDLPPETRFTPQVQDQLAHLLLRDAGIEDFVSGTLGRHAFMNNLAKIWAGLPNDTGRSHYHGFAGNKATMTWSYFDTQMQRIFAG